MTFKVLVHAFGNPRWREVVVPVGVYSDNGKILTKDLLDLIFQYGQNDFQSKNCPSVSVGDFIFIDFNEAYVAYVVENFGFSKIETAENR